MQKLLAEHGLPDDTPALLAEAVATPEQRLKRTTISKLATLLDSDSSSNPALILYGPLADMEDSDDD